MKRVAKKAKLLPRDNIINDLNKLCNKFINHKVSVNTFFTYDNQSSCAINPNSVGTILEELFFNKIQNELPNLTKGPSQQSPDYFLKYEDDNKSYNIECEMKCFKGTPNFDISNYDCYINQLVKDNGVYRKVFNTKYLIFQYDIEDNNICIKDFFFKNVWDLVNYNGKYPISVNNKKNIWHNIRPSTVIHSWTDLNKTSDLFINQIIESIKICPHNIENKSSIISEIENQYKSIL
jgi:hypothetical protein